MKAIFKALIWEFMQRAKYSMPGMIASANLIPIMLYGSSGRSAGGEHWLQMDFMMYSVIVMQVAFGITMSLDQPRRLYRLPLKTSFVELWSLGFGALIMLLVMLVTRQCYNQFFHTEWPLVSYLAFAIALWACVHQTLSLSLRYYLWWIPTAGVLVTWFHKRHATTVPYKYQPWSTVTVQEWILMFTLTIFSGLIGFYAIRRQRSNESLATEWLKLGWQRLLPYLPNPRQAPLFKSATAADAWFLWKFKGIAFPVIASVAVIVAIVSIYWQATPAEELDDVMRVVLVVSSFTAFVTGLIFVDSRSTPSQRSIDWSFSNLFNDQGAFSMSSFRATRPMSTAVIAKIILLSMLKSIAWGAVPLLLLLIGLTLFAEGLSDKTVHFLFLILPMVWLAPWIAMSSMASIAAAGRPSWIYGFILGLPLSMICLPLVITAIFPMRDQAERIGYLIASGICIAVVILAIAFTILAKRQSLIDAKQFRWMGVGLLGPVGYGLLLNYMHRDLGLAILAGMAALVVIPIPALPIALKLNRHR